MKKTKTEMRNKMNKKILVVMSVFLFAVIGMAALMDYYATTTITATVEQAVLIAEPSTTFEGAAGNIFCVENSLTNNAAMPLTAMLKSDNEDGIVIGIEKRLILENKTPGIWEGNESPSAILIYTDAGNYFNYNLEVAGLSDNNYSLIYYADIDETKPATGIVTVITDFEVIGGEAIVSGLKMFDEGLPFDGDYNQDPDPGDSYCGGENGFDYYENCHGAKIWVVPTDDIEGENLDWANWDEYLYETDLIEFSKENSTAEIYLEVGVPTPITLCYDFDTLLEKKIYTITTDFVPI